MIIRTTKKLYKNDLIVNNKINKGFKMNKR